MKWKIETLLITWLDGIHKRSNQIEIFIHENTFHENSQQENNEMKELRENMSKIWAEATKSENLPFIEEFKTKSIYNSRY